VLHERDRSSRCRSADRVRSRRSGAAVRRSSCSRVPNRCPPVGGEIRPEGVGRRADDRGDGRRHRNDARGGALVGDPRPPSQSTCDAVRCCGDIAARDAGLGLRPRPNGSLERLRCQTRASARSRSSLDVGRRGRRRSDVGPRVPRCGDHLAAPPIRCDSSPRGASTASRSPQVPLAASLTFDERTTQWLQTSAGRRQPSTSPYAGYRAGRKADNVSWQIRGRCQPGALKLWYCVTVSKPMRS